MSFIASSTCSIPATLIAQFAKAPMLGQVKTRLGGALSDQEKLVLHKNLVRHSVALIKGFSQHRENIDIQLWVTDSDVFFSTEIGISDEEVQIQKGIDLGQRMENMFYQNFHRYKRVVVIGSDCPFLTAQHLLQACDALATYECAISPAVDGGYVMLALAQHSPALFSNIEWGTSKVFEQTVQAAKKQGMKVKVLKELHDIDRPGDLAHLGPQFFKAT